jgi:hypothetical protein
MLFSDMLLVSLSVCEVTLKFCAYLFLRALAGVCKVTDYRLDQWFSNGTPRHTGAPQEVARCAVNIRKVYFKNKKKPICIDLLHPFLFLFIA